MKTLLQILKGEAKLQVGDSVVNPSPLEADEYFAAKDALYLRASDIGATIEKGVEHTLMGNYTVFKVVPSPFMLAVQEMRQAQKDYFANRSHEALKKAKKLEAAIDKLLP